MNDDQEGVAVEAPDNSESTSSPDTESGTADQTVTVVEVSNLDELYSYQQLHAGLMAAMIGVMLALILAIAWRSLHE